MNLSVNLMPEAPVSELVSLAKMAEELGYRRVWVYDEGLAMRDVYVTMTAIAAATTKVQISTSSAEDGHFLGSVLGAPLPSAPWPLTVLSR
jgi:alkanesulfonate monooxygenase SsuD/methylene tetrahydromethanopterin reductase-like flavin-dependent oxidoreductase (luciferase family)